MSDALFTDLYELTMMAGYLAEGRQDDPATFDLYFRSPPLGVDLVVAAGLEQALDYLERLAFTPDDLAYLASLDLFDDGFLRWLADLRFTGDVWAMPEGTPVFGGEPILRVTAPLGQAQLVETALLNRICYPSLVASNAVQLVTAARGKPILEFGARRAHGPDGALTGTRAAMVGGCAATSNVLAGARFGVDVAGTQAHAWVMAFETELESFRAYARAFPDSCVLLVDTYDTLRSGVPNAITVARELAADGHALSGVRLDSGDLLALSLGARRQLDAAGFPDVRILASGDLDAQRVAELEAADAPIDGYGVGTSLLTARQDPTFGGVYKLAEVAGKPVIKVSGSPEKTTSPGCKQVWRTQDGDLIGLADEQHPGQQLLVEVLRKGRRVQPAASVVELRDRCRHAVAELRPRLAAVRGAWPVRRSERLAALQATLIASHQGTSSE
jgi:nicotinate phosphoribosyltransferase